MPAADAGHSRFVQRVRRRYAAELPLLRPGVPDAPALQALIDTLLAGGRPLAAALRVARQLAIERLAVLDVEQHAPLADITGAMTVLAEVTLDRALAQALADADADRIARKPRLVVGAPLPVLQECAQCANQSRRHSSDIRRLEEPCRGTPWCAFSGLRIHSFPMRLQHDDLSLRDPDRQLRRCLHAWFPENSFAATSAPTPESRPAPV